jgi:hypothetical protein
MGFIRMVLNSFKSRNSIPVYGVTIGDCQLAYQMGFVTKIHDGKVIEIRKGK